jgi:hypothetical protein
MCQIHINCYDRIIIETEIEKKHIVKSVIGCLVFILFNNELKWYEKHSYRMRILIIGFVGSSVVSRDGANISLYIRIFSSLQS